MGLRARFGLVMVVGAALLLTSLAGPGGVQSMPLDLGDGPVGAGGAFVQPAAARTVAAHGGADVLVLLRDGMAPDAATDALARAADRVQDAVLQALAPGDFAVQWRYDVLPMLAGRVSEQGLASLRADRRVEAIELQEWLVPIAVDAPPRRSHPSQALAEAVPVIGADVVQRMGITGEGVTVAVLDTGIDNDHPDFAGKILDQYCYSGSRSCAPNNVVEGPNAQDEAGHGTAVSGIIASKGAVSSVGVAPGADLVAVRVFKDEGGASNADIIKGLDYVLRKQFSDKIRVVNMSLGGGAGRGNNCDDQNVNMKAAFGRLVARSVVIMVATGNDGFPSEVSSPGCISNAVAVGATYDGDYASGDGYCPQQKDVTPLTIACFTNRGRAMDLLAPGLFISSSKLGGGVTTPGAGTSYAAPMAAGVAALLLQADPSLRPNEIVRILQDTGRDVKHLENSDIFQLVDALRAVQSVLPATPTPVPPSATPTSAATSTPVRSATPVASSTPLVTPDESAVPSSPTATATLESPATSVPVDTEAPAGVRVYLPATKNLAP